MATTVAIALRAVVAYPVPRFKRPGRSELSLECSANDLKYLIFLFLNGSFKDRYIQDKT